MADDTRMDDPTPIARLRDPAQCRAAFGEVIALYQQPLYWQIRRMVENHEDANDLLQNTFLKAWDNIENFRGDAKLSTWLHKIAINESITFLARERKRLRTYRSTTRSRIWSTSSRPTQISTCDELALRLRKAIASLPEKQRLVFNMRYFDEMKYEQMSEILGTSVGAPKASYHHAAKNRVIFCRWRLNHHRPNLSNLQNKNPWIMNRERNDILDRLPRTDGMTVPEGIFRHLRGIDDGSSAGETCRKSPAKAHTVDENTPICLHGGYVRRHLADDVDVRETSPELHPTSGWPTTQSLPKYSLPDQVYQYYDTDIDQYDLLEELYEDGYTPASFHIDDQYN